MLIGAAQLMLLAAALAWWAWRGRRHAPVIAAPHNYMAKVNQFEPDVGRYPLYVSIEAWGADGYALVADHASGRLTRAADLPGFVETVKRHDLETIVGVFPGGGWSVAGVDTEGEPWVRPVIGWVVTDIGEARPIHAGTDSIRDYAYRTDEEDVVQFLPPTIRAGGTHGLASDLRPVE